MYKEDTPISEMTDAVEASREGKGFAFEGKRYTLAEVLHQAAEANAERNTMVRQQLADVTRERDALAEKLRECISASGVGVRADLLGTVDIVVMADDLIEWIESARRVL